MWSPTCYWLEIYIQGNFGRGQRHASGRTRRHRGLGQSLGKRRKVDDRSGAAGSVARYVGCDGSRRFSRRCGRGLGYREDFVFCGARGLHGELDHRAWLPEARLSRQASFFRQVPWSTASKVTMAHSPSVNHPPHSAVSRAVWPGAERGGRPQEARFPASLTDGHDPVRLKRLARNLGISFEAQAEQPIRFRSCF